MGTGTFSVRVRILGIGLPAVLPLGFVLASGTRNLADANSQTLVGHHTRQIGGLGHARKLLSRVDRESGGQFRGAVVHLLVDDLKQRQLELVAALLADAEVREHEEGGILVVDVLEVVQRGDRGAGEESSAPVVNDVKFGILVIATDKARKEEVVRVCVMLGKPNSLARAWLCLTLHVHGSVTVRASWGGALPGAWANRGDLLAVAGDDLELDDGSGINRSTVGCGVRTLVISVRLTLL